jgi:putative transposase
MQQRKVVLAKDEIYHIYNRSIAKEQIFTSLSQLNHMFETIDYYRYPQILRYSEFRKLTNEAKQIYQYNMEQKNPLVEIFTFSFMPNHFHILLRQTEENGIKQFISILQNSYAKYFNTRYHRQGGLFQSPFQARWIETDEQFIHVSRYIHLNHVTSYIIPIEKLANYQYSSYSSYLGISNTTWLNSKPILGFFSSTEKYKQFVEDQVDYQRTLAKFRDITIE